MITVKINKFTYEVKFEDDEGICDFMGAYAEDIVREADRILKEYKDVEQN